MTENTEIITQVEEITTVVEPAPVWDLSPERAMRVALLRKISAFRAEIQMKDWSPDKMMSGGTPYPYLSVDKVKRTIAPILVKHGLEFDIQYYDLEQHADLVTTNKSLQHWTVRAEATFTDIDTGETKTYRTYGEGSDVLDKSVPKCMTMALKQVFVQEFGIVDGIDPSFDDSEAPAGSFHRKSPEEQEAVKSKVLAGAVKPSAPAPKAAKPVAPVPAPKAEAPAPKAEVKEEKPAEEPELVGKYAEAVDVSEIVSKLPTPQKKAIEHIMKTFEEKAKAGEMEPEQYNEMSADYALIRTPADAAVFISKHKVI